jgi:twinkle protein
MYYDRLSDLGIKLTRHSGNEKTICPQCSDGRKNKRDKCLSVNITTGEYNCHNCGWKGNCRSLERKREEKHYERPGKDYVAAIQRKERTEKYFAKRGISVATLEKFLIFSRDEFMPQTGQKENCICFPYFRDGELINIKFRDARKNFRMIAGAELIFYNLSSIGEKKKVIITEGEIDALSCYEAGIGQDLEPFSDYGILSVPNGASKGNQRLDYLDNCADWFMGLEEIIIATDGDEAGMMLRDELMRRLGVERCRILTYPEESRIDVKGELKRPCKDLNEVLIHFGRERILECVLQAKSIPVDGVYFVEDIFGSMFDNFKKGIKLAPETRFRDLDNYFRWKKGAVNVFTGYANAGKTFFVTQLMLTKSMYDGWKWAVFSPENYPANDFYDDIIEMYNGKSLSETNNEEYVSACEFLNEHFFYVYPDNDHDLLSIHDKFRYLVLKKGIDGVVIDPFNQLDHNQKTYQREDQYLSDVLKDIKRFALLNNVTYNIVAHPKNPKYEQDKSLPVVDMYDLYGGSMWGNKADHIISYHRPNWHLDKNSPEVEIHIQKVKRKRTGGKQGMVEMRLNWDQKRYIESSESESFCDPKRAKGYNEMKEPPKIIETYRPAKNWYEKEDIDPF